MRLRKLATLTLLMLALFAAPVAAQTDTVIFDKDGEEFTVEDLALFYTEQMGGQGFLAFVQNVVVYQRGKELGLEPSQQEIDDFIENSLSQSIYDNYRDVFSERTVDRMIESWIIQEKYARHVRQEIQEEQNIQISDQEARQWFIENKTRIDKPPRVVMSIISVPDRATAEEALAELEGGADFSEVAAQYNDQPELSASGGFLGEVPKGELAGPVDEAAFNLEPGEHSEIIQSNRFNIIKVHEKLPEQNPSFEDVSQEVKQILLEQRLQEPLNQRYQQLIEEAFGEIDIQTPLFQPSQDSPIQFGSGSG